MSPNNGHKGGALSEETPKDFRPIPFQGIFIEASLYFMIFRDRILTTNESYLLLNIRGFCVERENGSFGKCFATNAYFSDMLGVSENMVQKMISKLVKLKLVERKFQGNRRYLFAEPSVKPTRKNGRGVESHYTPRVESHYTPRVESHSTHINSKSIKKKYVAQVAQPSFGIVDSQETKHQKKCRWLATTLFKRLSVLNKITKTPNLKDWIREFERLDKQTTCTMKEIRQVLEWYLKYLDANRGNKYAIKAYAARSFREKFDAIRNKMLDAKTSDGVSRQKEEGCAVPPPASLFQKVKELRIRVTEDVLESAVSTSFENLSKLRDAVHVELGKYYKSWKDEAQKHKWPTKTLFCESLVKRYFGGDSERVTFNWFRDREKSLRGWKDWSGSLNTLVFDFSNKASTDFLETMSREFFGDSRGVQVIKEELGIEFR